MSGLPEDILAAIGEAGPDDLIALEPSGGGETMMVSVADLVAAAKTGIAPDTEPAIAWLLSARAGSST